MANGRTVTSARHLKDDPAWQTPAEYVEAARDCMGGIDLDPMSDDEAQTRVKATRYFTALQDGLRHDWIGRVFINPAGGLVNKAWLKLTVSVAAHHVTAFVWIGFSLEQLQTIQSSFAVKHPLDFHVCIPRRRISFVEGTAHKEQRRLECIGTGKAFKERLSPTHANYVVGAGMSGDAFKAAFEQFGVVRVQAVQGATR